MEVLDELSEHSEEEENKQKIDTVDRKKPNEHGLSQRQDVTNDKGGANIGTPRERQVVFKKANKEPKLCHNHILFPQAHYEPNPNAMQKAANYRLNKPNKKPPVKKIVRHRRSSVGQTSVFSSDDRSRYLSSPATLTEHGMLDIDMDIEEMEAAAAATEDDTSVSAYDTYSKSTEDGQINEAVYKLACSRLGVEPTSYILKHLKTSEIVMRYHSLGPLGAKACAIALVNNVSVTTLELEGNDIGPEGTFHIVEMLLENLYITKLGLAENNIGTRGLQYIVNVIPGIITYLDLSGNGLKDSDAIFIADMLEDNNVLVELRLSHNELNEEGGKILGDVLQHNETLTTLDLSWNHLRREGAAWLCLGIKNNVALKRLNLAWNGLHLQGCKAMALLLQENHILEWLDLSSNRITMECLTFLLKGIKDNQGLHTLKIGHNPITTDGAFSILNTFENACGTIKLKELDIGNQCVDNDFVTLLKKLTHAHDVTVKHGVILRQDLGGKNDNQKEGDSQGLMKEDPMTILMELMRLQNLRLVDLFTALDKDGSKSLTREEFLNGLSSLNISLPKDVINKLIDNLDVNKDGQVDYSELLAGQKVHKNKVNRIREREKDVPFEDTEVGKVSTKLRALMALQGVHIMKPPPGGGTNIEDSEKTPLDVIHNTDEMNKK